MIFSYSSFKNVGYKKATYKEHRNVCFLRKMKQLQGAFFDL